MEALAQSRLGVWLTGVLGQEARINGATKLSGGAIQENWLIDAVIGGTGRALVIRKDAAATLSVSHSRADEFALIMAAHKAGVLVPTPLAFCDDASVLGGPFAVMAKVDGVGLGPRIVKDMALGGDREALTERLGRELALIHAIRLPRDDLAFLGKPPANPAHAEIGQMRAALDVMQARRPALEWAMRWAEQHVPSPARITLCHRDFRTGNYMVDASGLTAILDWEFAGWGDPMSDLGWFCARCWRFGRVDLEAGGIGTRASFHKGYAAAGGDPVSLQAVFFWEVMAHIRWAVIALQQGVRHSSGAELSLEHALTGRIAAELEHGVLAMTAPDSWRLA